MPLRVHWGLKGVAGGMHGFIQLVPLCWSYLGLTGSYGVPTATHRGRNVLCQARSLNLPLSDTGKESNPSSTSGIQGVPLGATLMMGGREGATPFERCQATVSELGMTGYL